MQEEANEKTVAFLIQSEKMTAGILKSSLEKLLRDIEQERREQRIIHATQKQMGTGTVKRAGKKTLAEMVKEGSDLSNIEITDQNIRSFEKVARKYHVQYSLKKDRSVEPPRYLVFFRAKDVDLMTAAFREYTGMSLNKKRRISVRKKLQKALERTAKHKELEKVRTKDRRPVR